MIELDRNMCASVIAKEGRSNRIDNATRFTVFPYIWLFYSRAHII